VVDKFNYLQVMLESTGLLNKQEKLAKAQGYQALVAIDLCVSATPNVPLQKPALGVPVTEVGNICRQLTGAVVHPSQGVRHRAKGCMALGW
jgi:hypothetical protein